MTIGIAMADAHTASGTITLSQSLTLKLLDTWEPQAV